jgi:hypothetical protein
MAGAFLEWEYHGYWQRGMGMSDSGHVRMVHSHAYYREETVAYKES